MAFGKRDRVAVVGAGAAGLAAAWTLSQKYDVTIYESLPALGGHAFAHPFKNTGVHVDMGVMITLPWAYPNLYCMFQRFGVRTSAAGATLMVSFPSAKPGERDTWGTDASLRQTDLFKRIEKQASRFEQLMFEIGALSMKDQQQPIDHFLKHAVPGLPNSGGYDDEFVAKGLCPLLSLFLVTRDSLLETPAWSLSMMFRYGTISFFSPTTWRTVDGGTREYIARLTRSFELQQRLGTKVTAISRNNGDVSVTDDKGRTERYDQVVLATDAKTALALLDSPSDDEKELLSKFRYEDAIAYLHEDPSVLADQEAKGIFFHYRSENPAPVAMLDGTMTYDMKRAAGLDAEEGPVLVSVVTKPRTLHPKPVWTQEFSHMIADQPAIEARLALNTIQGKRRVWFCGDYTTFASHEDAFVSGMLVGEAMGCRYLFREHAAAFERYRMNRLLMFRPWQASFGAAARLELAADIARTLAGSFWVWWNGKFPD